MSPDNPIGLCCSRPQLNAVGGIDERTWPYELMLALRRLKRDPGTAAETQTKQVGPPAD
jgi:hypothetical protein